MSQDFDDSRATEPAIPTFFGDLVMPVRGTSSLASALDLDARRQLRRLLTLRPIGVSAALRDGFRRAQASLKAVAQADLPTAAQIVREPTVAALLDSVGSNLDGANLVGASLVALRALTLNLLFELSSRGLLPKAVTLRGAMWSQQPVFSVRLGGRLTFATGGGLAAEEIVIYNGKIPMGAVIEPVYHPVWRGVCLALADNNPTSVFRDHPEQPAGRLLGLGAKPLQAWIDGLCAAFALIEQHLPAIASELALAARLILPVGSHDETHFSASYGHMPGCAYMSLHPSTLTMAEGLVHEFQHNKILTAIRTDPLWLNPAAQRFPSPLRPDLRPMRGVVLAAHAFVPVAALHRALLRVEDVCSKAPRFEQRRREVLQKNADALATIDAHALVTPAGALVVDQLRTLDAETRGKLIK